MNDTGLGRFIEMAEVRDGGLWITGANGLAKVEGQLRQISNKSEWRIENLQESLARKHEELELYQEVIDRCYSFVAERIQENEKKQLLIAELN